MSEREELSEIISYAMNNEFQDPSGHAAEAVLSAGYRKVSSEDVREKILALIDYAENLRGSSMYCKVTTFELRQALGLEG
jgi:hypothetical protein